MRRIGTLSRTVPPNSWLSGTPIERLVNRLDAAGVLADDERTEKFKLGRKRILGRAHVRRRGGVTEAFDAVLGRDAHHVAVSNRAPTQRKAPGRVLLAHRAWLDVEIANNHRAVPSAWLAAVFSIRVRGSTPRQPCSPDLRPPLRGTLQSGLRAANRNFSCGGAVG